MKRVVGSDENVAHGRATSRARNHVTMTPGSASHPEETSMLQRRRVPLIILTGLLPFVLAACTDAASSTDPRTQSPLVRTEPVRNSASSTR